jgi:hypothetical protein
MPILLNSQRALGESVERERRRRAERHQRVTAYMSRVPCSVTPRDILPPCQIPSHRPRRSSDLTLSGAMSLSSFLLGGTPVASSSKKGKAKASAQVDEGLDAVFRSVRTLHHT